MCCKTIRKIDESCVSSVFVVLYGTMVTLTLKGQVSGLHSLIWPTVACVEIVSPSKRTCNGSSNQEHKHQRATSQTQVP